MITQSQIEIASVWLAKHSEHVKKLVKDLNSEGAFPPSDEDANHPELWKPAHWRWFLKSR